MFLAGYRMLCFCGVGFAFLLAHHELLDDCRMVPWASLLIVQSVKQTAGVLL